MVTASAGAARDSVRTETHTHTHKAYVDECLRRIPVGRRKRNALCHRVEVMLNALVEHLVTILELWPQQVLAIPQHPVLLLLLQVCQDGLILDVGLLKVNRKSKRCK